MILSIIQIEQSSRATAEQWYRSSAIRALYPNISPSFASLSICSFPSKPVVAKFYFSSIYAKQTIGHSRFIEYILPFFVCSA
jgi:hypothetical protein